MVPVPGLGGGCHRRDRYFTALLAGLSHGRAYRQGQETEARADRGHRLRHVDLQAAIDRGITVAEVTYCNSISVAEHVVMMILGLVRNYIPSYQWVVKGGWNIADCVARAYDVEGMSVGTVAAGRIGLAVLRRLMPFDVKLHYTDRHRLTESVEKELGLTFHP